jgi:hypothetical protein
MSAGQEMVSTRTITMLPATPSAPGHALGVSIEEREEVPLVSEQARDHERFPR